MLPEAYKGDLIQSLYNLPRKSGKAETSERLFSRDRVNQRGNGNANEVAAV